MILDTREDFRAHELNMVGNVFDLIWFNLVLASTTSSKMLFIFGGVTEFGLMNDFFTFDPSAIKWKSVLRSSGSWPQRRAGHSLNYLEEKLILFGGRDESRVGTGIGLAHSLNDVWIYDTTSGRWLETESFTSSKNKVTPSGRQHAATCVYAGNLWVFGGVDYTTHITYNDLWSFDINSYQWTMRSPNSGHVNGFSPPPLHHAHLLPNVESDLSNAGLLVYGGVGSGGSCGGWKCNASQLVIGQLYRFDTAVGEWGSERVAGSGLGGSQADVQSCTWKFARISNSNDWSMGGSGKYEKNHVLEGAAVSVERKLLFDFGGVLTPPDATNEMPTTAHATQERYGQGKEYHSAGGLLKNGPWDLYTGEQLRESVDIPVRKSFWPLVDVDERPLHETEYVRFAKQLSQFTMASQDVVLLSVSEFE